MQQVLLSPVQYIGYSYIAIAVLGLAFYDDVADANTGASLRLELTSNMAVMTFWLFAVAAGAFIFGAALFTLLTGSLKPTKSYQHNGNLNRPLTQSARQWLLVGACLPLAIVFLDTPLPLLLSREHYLVTRTGVTSGLGSTLAIGSIAVLAYLAAVERGRRRTIALVMIVIFSALFFSLGSRRFALVPMLIVIGAAPILNRHRLRVISIVGVFALLYLGQLPFYLRGLDRHGLVPYALAMPNYVAGNVGIDSVLNGALVSFPLSGVTAFVEPAISFRDHLTAINPLPGGPAGWYTVAPRHRFNQFTPYTAVGELGNSGWPLVVGYFTFIGFIFGYLDRRIGIYLRSSAALFAYAILGLSALFVLNSIQYNLRSATRLVYYAIAIDLFGRLVLRGSANRRRVG